MENLIIKRVSYDQGCLKAVRKLPDYVSGKFLDLMSRYMDNPASNGLNLETVNGSRDKSLKSLRLDQNYRAIAFETAKDIMFVHVNEHDKAYQWAKGRRVKLDTATNRIRIVEEIEQELEQTISAQGADSSLFDGFKDKKLIQLGVAEEFLPLIRVIVDVNELESYEDRFDQLSFQVLYGLAAGYTEEEVYSMVGHLNTDDSDDSDDDATFEELIDTNESRQTIFTPQNIEELRRFFDGELEGWRVWLHPEQRKLAYKDYNGPAMVRGGAGTGKTVVAMHRAKALADVLAKSDKNKGKKILVTTFTTTLAKDIEANLKTLCPEHFKSTPARIEIINLDRWATQYLKKKQFNRTVVSFDSNDEMQAIWTDAIDQTIPDGLSDSFIRAEWEQIIQAKGINELQSYLRVSRVGRGTQLNRNKRKELWNIFEKYRAGLVQAGLAERDDVYREALPLLLNEPGKLDYAGVVVDEAQDMGEQAFKLIRAIMSDNNESDANSIFIVGDAHQRIYNRKTTMSSCGINVVGRSRKLKLNYRTTHEIRALAVSILEGVEIDDLDDGYDTFKGYVSLHHGSAPLLSGYNSDNEEIEALAQWINELPDDSIKQSEIGVLAFSNKDLKSIQTELENRNIKTLKLTTEQADDQQKGGVRLCTMHRAKGLEFKAVAIPFMSASKYPPVWLTNQCVDEADKEDLLTQLRSLLHVAATRAKGHLRLSWSGKICEFILKK
jgi:superfamily I DNA/RNA helicase